jgi:ABC-2 type transport system ATP-binding protein
LTLELEDIEYRYRKRDRPVFEGLTVSVPVGRTILLGPNGAGKSTLLGIAASVLGPNPGSVRADGLIASGRRQRGQYRRHVSWMPQTVRPAAGLTVREQVALHGWLAGMGRSEAWDSAIRALDRVQLRDTADRRAAQLSGGQRARMGLAQALVYSASVLLLDEPTAALDPDQKQVFAALLVDVAEGRTILVSTHDVADLEDSYDHVLVLADGRIRFDGTVGEFMSPAGRRLDAVEAYRAALSR